MRSREGWPTHLYTRSKSKAFSFPWNSSENSLQRVSSEADRKMGTPYLSWLIIKNIDVQILHVTYSGVCVLWTQKRDGCHSKRGSTSTDVLPANSTITGSFYAETVLAKVVQQISSQRSLTTTTTQKVLLPRDNASPKKLQPQRSTTKDTNSDLKDKKSASTHPRCSADFACVCDFYFIPWNTN